MGIFRLKVGKYFFSTFLIICLVFVFAPVGSLLLLNVSLAIDEEDDVIETDTEWSGVVVVNKPVLISSGVTLVITKGTIIEFIGQGRIDTAGTIRAEGTPSDPIIFRMKEGAGPDDFYTIRARSSGKIYAKNINVSGGGSAKEAFLVEKPRIRFLNYAQAMWSYHGAMTAIDGGIMDIDAATFHDNATAILTDRASTGNTKVWRSRFERNTMDIVSDSFASNNLDARYNWWGQSDGPVECLEYECEGAQVYQKIIGKVSFLNWATTEFFKDPVIIIPGLLGSW